MKYFIISFKQWLAEVYNDKKTAMTYGSFCMEFLDGYVSGRRRGLNCNTDDPVPSPPWRLPTSCYSQLYIIHYYFFQDSLF